jgi:ribosomal protein S18 acetylase RimI-like enzyme
MGVLRTSRHDVRVDYINSALGLTPDHLDGGFFEGWIAAPTPEQHLAILRSSAHVVVAREPSGQVVGFVNALSDGLLTAYIPLLEVLPDFRGTGVGSELTRRLLAELGPLYMIDVLCDEEMLGFYERLGFAATRGAVIRNYEWTALRS